jgi:hypothetical protein
LGKRAKDNDSNANDRNDCEDFLNRYRTRSFGTFGLVSWGLGRDRPGIVGFFHRHESDFEVLQRTGLRQQWLFHHEPGISGVGARLSL